MGDAGGSKGRRRNSEGEWPRGQLNPRRENVAEGRRRLVSARRDEKSTGEPNRGEPNEPRAASHIRILEGHNLTRGELSSALVTET